MSEQSALLEDRTRQLLDCSPVPMLVVDGEFRIRATNREWVSAVEAESVDAVRGTSVLEFLTDDERETAADRLERAVRDREPVETREFRFQTVDGQPRHAEGSVVPVSLTTGANAAHVVIENVSDLRRTEREAAHRRKQIEQLYEVGIELAGCDSPQRVYDLIVETLVEVLDLNLCVVGIVEDGLLSVKATSSEVPEDGYAEMPIDSEESGLAGVAYRRNESLLVADATEHSDANPQGPYKSALTVPMEGVGTIQAAAYETDAFDRTDLELVELVGSHAREVLKRIEGERELRERQQDLDLLRQVFSRVFRHNVRNELALVRGHAQSIRSDRDDDLATAADEVLGATDRLLDHTEKARQVEEVVKEQRETRSTSLSRTVAAAVEDYASHPEVTIRTSVEDVSVTAVPDVERAIANAVENAIEHTDGEVTVDLSSRVHDDAVTLVVEDDGDGIPHDEVDAIHREQETSLTHSSGIGLWLMKWAVEKSGGRLDVTATGEGTRVEMTLPRG